MSGKHKPETEIVQTTDNPIVSEYVRVGWKLFPPAEIPPFL